MINFYMPNNLKSLENTFLVVIQQILTLFQEIHKYLILRSSKKSILILKSIN